MPHFRESSRPIQPLPRLRRALLQDILRQLGIAQEAITQSLQSATRADAVRRLRNQRNEIARVMGVYQQAVTQLMVTTADRVWQAGIDSVAAQTGMAFSGRLDARMLLATQNYMTHKIADITRETASRLNTALTQHLLGVRDMSGTVTEIARLLGGAPRSRAMGIAYTETGRVYSASQYETMLGQAKTLPGLKKQWVHSGKAHPRPGHLLCAEQTAAEPIPVDQPFEVVDLRTGEVEPMRFPRDPNASAYNTINCGCMMVAVPPEPDELFAGELTQEQIEDATLPEDGIGNIGIWGDEVFAQNDPVGPDAGGGEAPGGDNGGMPANEPLDPRYSNLQAEQAQALEAFERDLLRKPEEWVGLLGEDGQILFTQQGTLQSVRIEGLSTEVSKGRVMTHNHLDDSLPSIQDVFTAMGYGVAEMRIVGPAGVYRLLPPQGGWKLVDLVDQEGELRQYALAVRDDLRVRGVPQSQWQDRISRSLFDEMVRRRLIRLEYHAHENP